MIEPWVLQRSYLVTRKFILALSLMSAIAGLSSAEEPTTASGPTFSIASVDAEQATSAPACETGCAAFDDCCGEQSPPRSWISAEYLLWWVKNAPLPVLNSNLDYGTFSGARLTAGSWLDSDCTLGMEASGFLLEQRSADQSATATSVPITLPVFGPVFPSAALQSHTRLWGAEANGLFNVRRGDGYHADLLAGFRFLSLDENLTAQTAVSGDLAGFPLVLQTQANFQTQNQFYGGQVGGKVGGRSGRFAADVIGKVALGSMHEASNLTALASTSAAGFTSTAGILARQTRDEFAVLPQVTLQLGYDMTDSARLFVGYDFLYVSDVLRAGNNASTGQGIAPFKSSDFWAQGVSFGVLMRF